MLEKLGSRAFDIELPGPGNETGPRMGFTGGL